MSSPTRDALEEDVVPVWVLRPGVGLGGLVFGAARDDVYLYLGNPEDVSEDLLGPDPRVAWYYWKLGIGAHFSGVEGFRLGTLQVERADAELFSRRLIGRPEESVRAVLTSFGLGEFEYEVMEFADHPTLSLLSY